MIFKFTSRRSTHMRIVPLDFRAITIGDTHFEASICSMTPLFWSRLISSVVPGCNVAPVDLAL